MKTEAVRNPTDGIIYDVRAYLNSLDSLAIMTDDYALSGSSGTVSIRRMQSSRMF